MRTKSQRSKRKSPLLNHISRYMQGLQPRERKLVTGLAIFLCVVVLVWGILLPAWDYAVSAQQRFEQERDDLIWMSQNIERVQGVNSAGQRRDILSSVVSSARENQLTIKRYEPEGDNGLRIWLENVEFNAAWYWLATLRSDHGIRAEDVLIDRAQTSGFADLRLTLRGGE